MAVVWWVWVLGLAASGFAAAAPSPPPPPAAPPTVDSIVATRWLPADRAVDWSRAGYKGGERGIPLLASWKVFDVTAYGARANSAQLADAGVQAALQAALNYTGGNRVLRFPAGRFLLSQPIYANVSGLVIRGAGVDRTTLVYTRALSDVFGMQYAFDPCTKSMKNLWSSGGAMIVMSGGKQRENPLELAQLVVPKQLNPGATVLQVNSSASLAVGQWVELVVDDESTFANPSAECAGLNGGGGSASMAASTAGLNLLPMSQRAQQNPIVRLAAETMAMAHEGGPTVQQAIAAAKQQSADTGLPATAMAKPGTIAAWIYSENMADSGGHGAINPTSVRFAFKVQRIYREGNSSFVVMDRDVVFPVKPKWRASLREYRAGIEKSGVEGLTIAFQNSGRFTGHFTDRGYNAVQLAYAANCWIRNVRVQNADNGLFVYHTSFVTLDNVTVTSVDRTIDDDRNVNGHHAIYLNGPGQNNLCTRFNIAARYIHDASVATSQKLAVYSRGGGVDLNMDHHRAGPFSNLFTNINVGAATRPFASGGRDDRGANAGRGETFWNIRAASPSKEVKLPKCDWGALLTFVLPKRTGDTCSSMKWNVTTWKDNMPVDLLEAQVALRRSLVARRG